jgi:hypothetical protein
MLFMSKERIVSDRISSRLTDEAREKLQDLVDRSGRSYSALLNEMIVEFHADMRRRIALRAAGGDPSRASALAAINSTNKSLAEAETRALRKPAPKSRG